MTALPPSVRRRMLVRSLAVQGSWNYETLIGTGFAFTLLPALRHLSNGDEQALQTAIARHATLFNSHPYLATVAAGAVARLEADRVDPVVIARFKNALRGSLGSLGDQLVWGAWRPAAALLAVVLVLAGVVWWVAVAIFLLVYNLLHLVLRTWGLRIGREAGLEVGRALRAAPLQAVARRAADGGAFLAGFAVLLALAPAADQPVDILAGGVAAGAGFWLGARARQVFGAAVFLSAIVALFLGLAR